MRSFRELSKEEKEEVRKEIERLKKEGENCKRIAKIMEGKGIKIDPSSIWRMTSPIYRQQIEILSKHRYEIANIYFEHRNEDVEDILKAVYERIKELEGVSDGKVRSLIRSFKNLDEKRYVISPIFCWVGFRIREFRSLAGYETKKQWNEESVKEAYLKLKEELGRVPTSREFMSKYGGGYDWIKRNMGGWNNFVRMMGDDVHYQRYEDSFKMRLVREYYKTDVSQKSLENKYCIGGSSIYKWTSLPSILERFLEEEGCKICSEEELEKIVHAKKLPLLKDKLKKAGLSLERGGKKFYGSRKYLKQLKLLYDLLLSS